MYYACFVLALLTATSYAQSVGNETPGDGNSGSCRSPDSYAVLRQSETERPFSSELNDEKRSGEFFCAGCGARLFNSATKYDSGSGWPSFTTPIPSAVSLTKTPFEHIIKEREVVCARCGGHLGHVFPANTPTGDRFCINGLALNFVPSEKGSPHTLNKVFES